MINLYNIIINNNNDLLKNGRCASLTKINNMLNNKLEKSGKPRKKKVVTIQSLTEENKSLTDK
jgi:hypothetical protein